MSWEQELKTTVTTMMQTDTFTNKRIDKVENTIDKEIPSNKDLLQVILKIEELEQQIINLNAKIKGLNNAR